MRLPSWILLETWVIVDVTAGDGEQFILSCLETNTDSRCLQNIIFRRALDGCIIAILVAQELIFHLTAVCQY